MVNHASKGKNNIGMVSPGNNSGNSIFKGRDIEMGINMSANERRDVVILNISSAFFLTHLDKIECKKARPKPAEIFKPIMV